MDLETLAGKLATAKREEAEAKERRIQVEEEILPLIETPENGSKTVEAGVGLKLTVKRGLIYKADIDAIKKLNLPANIIPIKTKPAQEVLDEKGYEWIVKNDHETALKLAKCVTVTAAKPSVSLKIG